MMLDRTTPRWVNIYTYNGETFPGAAFWHSRENARPSVSHGRGAGSWPTG